MGKRRGRQLPIGPDMSCTDTRSAAYRESCSSSLARGACAVLACCALFSLISLVGLAFPVAAQAAVWPLSVSESSVSLGFHQTYTAGDRSYVHSGADIPASAGLQIFTPLAGTVRFTGAVPSGDSRVGQGGVSDKTMRAVSVQVADGHTVTLMPFASISVRKGQRVEEGQVLGTLAASGDVSSPGTHLHIGLKDGDVYYDPLSLFGAARTASSKEREPEAVQPLGQRETTASPASNAAAVQAPAVSSALDTPAGEGAPAQPEESFGTISSADVAWTPEGQPGFLERAGAGLRAALQPCIQQAQALWAALCELAGLIGAPAGLVAGLFAATLLGLCAGLFRAVCPLVGNLWRSRICPLVARMRG